MTFITNIPFRILVNGSASPFFTSERGLRQDCPLSPLLFLLVMEGVNRLINEEHRRGRLKGIKITEGCMLTHLLFVDDILIFLNGIIGDLSIINATFSLFQVATSMLINDRKSTLIAAKCTPHEIYFSLQRFRFSQLQLSEGLKYLGYKLKPLGYKIVD